MEKPDLMPGEEIYYIDPDLIHWGPWRVLRVANDDVAVMVENRIEFHVPRRQIVKVRDSLHDACGKKA